MGDSSTVTSDLVELHIEKCVGTNCKSEKEILTFLEDVQLAIAMKDSTFHRENYNDSETVKQINRLFLESIIGHKKAVLRELQIKREILYSDHKFYSLGVFPEEPKEFTTLPETTNRFLGFSEFNGIYSLQFNYSLN